MHRVRSARSVSKLFFYYKNYATTTLCIKIKRIKGMGKSQRRAERYNKNLTIDLFLRDDASSSVLAGPAPCFVNDLSSYGAGLILNQIHLNGHHLFYAPEDNPNYQLYLEHVEGEGEDEKLSVPVRPVWFNLDDNDEVHYFHLGVEFLVDPNDPRITGLKKIAAGKKEVYESWLSKLLPKFMK